MLELNKLTTEARNPGTAGLDTMTPLEIATVMNREDEQVVAGVRKVLPEVADRRRRPGVCEGRGGG